MKIGEQLKRARSQIGKTQEEVANALHVSRQTISSWENKRSYPDISSLLNLSDYYNLSLDHLLKEDTGMIEEIKRNEQLSKTKTMWRLSYLINIMFLLLIFLGTIFKRQWFQLGFGAQIVVVITLLLNVGILSILTHERNVLTKTAPKWHLSPQLLRWVLVVEWVVLLVVGALTMAHILNSYTPLGFICGVLCASIFYAVLKKGLFTKGK
ncbi:helix-turn-helix domain-containing protein [Enterococcus italicus]|uniref:helix-turn-helix domain-containing protein n=1 Tax=Enterococcus italicus TaxID=246144 RepID=UPI00207403DA|nr:helix-turn-helix transcriptional regulator [Enterococcus italicus]MCM6931528.1 helix-turn-helix domain-containing protein [Enterococcus italicus]